MNTPELKVGQRFLSRLEADNEITEVTVKQVTADGSFIKCSWSYRVVQSAFAAYDDRTQWFAAGELSVLHVLDDGTSFPPINPGISGPPPFDDRLRHKFAKEIILDVSFKKTPTENGKWKIRGILESGITGNICWTAIESTEADAGDESHETIAGKIIEVANSIPESFRRYLEDPHAPKPTTVAALDPAFSSTGKAMIVSSEVTDEGIKITDIKEANE